MQERKNSKNYVRLGKSVAGGKDGIRLESNSENSISVRKEIYEACLTNSSTGRNGGFRVKSRGRAYGSSRSMRRG